MPEPPVPSEAANDARRAAVEAWLAKYPDKTLRWFADRWHVSNVTVLNWLSEYEYKHRPGGWRKDDE